MFSRNGTATKKTGLNRFLASRFFRAALLPLFIVELALVVLYFAINAYNHYQTRDTLQDISKSHLHHLTKDQSDKIAQQLQAIATLAGVLQTETERFFNDPNSFPQLRGSVGFDVASNGVYYKTTNDGGASLFYSTAHPLTAEGRNKAQQSEILDPVYRQIYNSNPNIVAVYFNTFDSMNRYYPFIEDCYAQFPSDMDIPQYNFYYEADAAHNPSGQPVWTEVYLDPAGKGWMASCIVPIYRGDFLEGVAGIDVTIDRFVNNLLSLSLPWDARAFLVDAHGTIMAMPAQVEQVLGLTELHEHVYTQQVHEDMFKPEEFNLLASTLPGVAPTVSNLMQKNDGVEELEIASSPWFLTQSTVPEIGWKLFVLADRNRILAPVEQLAANIKALGYAIIAVIISFFILYLLYLLKSTTTMTRQLSKPVIDIVNASKRLAAGDYNTALGRCGIQEFDTLSASFGTMAQELGRLYTDLETRVDQRTSELKAANASLQAQIAQRKQKEVQLQRAQEELVEASHRAGMAEVATDVLHNVGNVLNSINVSATWISETLSNSEIPNLKRVAEMMQDHKDDMAEFFTTDAKGRYIPSYLNKAAGLLSDQQSDVMTKLSTLVDDVNHIKSIVKMQQEYTRVSGVEVVTTVDEVIEDAVRINQEGLRRHKIRLVRDYADLGPVSLDKQRVMQILVNLIGNAKYALGENGVEDRILTIRSGRCDDRVRIEVIDNGVGISSENLTKIFRHGFTTKKDGHGFGLHSGALAAKEMSGALSVHSDGPGYGATFTLELPFRPASETQEINS